MLPWCGASTAADRCHRDRLLLLLRRDLLLLRRRLLRRPVGKGHAGGAVRQRRELRFLLLAGGTLNRGVVDGSGRRRLVAALRPACE